MNWKRTALVFATGGLILIWWGLHERPVGDDFVSAEWLDAYHGTSHHDQRKAQEGR